MNIGDNLISDLAINIIASILVALPSLIVTIILFIRSFNISKFYNSLFSSLRTRDATPLERYRLKHYIKHSLTLESLGADDEVLSYRKFIRKIKHTKIVILTGSAGIGKSKLMQRLALQYRTRIQKGTKGDKLTNFGILFYRLTGDKTVDAVISRIKGDVGNSQVSYTLFLDGLDEMSGLQEQGGDEILMTLVRALEQEVSSSCSKIFISLRPEILKSGYSFSEMIPDVEVSTFKVRNFNRKQILAMYRNETRNRGSKDGKLPKIPAKTRKENIRKLKSVIQTNPDDSVFTYPLILTWANEILSKRSTAELNHISWYEALGEVIDMELQRECQTHCSARNIAFSPTFLAQFTKQGKTFLTEIAKKMALSHSMRVSGESVLSDPIACRLLRYVEWSEKNDTQPYYEFLHSTIYWRALAEVLLDPATPQSERAEIILSQAKNKSPLLQYCRQGLWFSEHGRRALPYADNFAYMRALAARGVECTTKDNEMSPEVILSCFYGFEEVAVGPVKFNFAKIKEFVKERKLNLSYANIADLSLVDRFGDDSFDYLDCAYSQIEDAAVPNYVKRVRFYKCARLKNATLPNGVTCIENCAFYDCALLKTVALPDSVMSIEDAAFYQCASLTSITIPDSVKSIGRAAFSVCTSLTAVTIPDGVISIGEFAFYGCSSLKNITLPNSIMSIERGAFSNSSLTSVTIPGKVYSIGTHAFDSCTSLTNVALSNGVTSIEDLAFVGCSSLTTVTIPSSVKSIAKSVFALCTSLKQLTYNGTIQDWKDIEKSDDCFYNSTVAEVICEDGVVKIEAP